MLKMVQIHLKVTMGIVIVAMVIILGVLKMTMNQMMPKEALLIR